MMLSHDEALDRLLASSPTGGPADADATEHVARCPSCWAVVWACHRAHAGDDHTEAERMAALFGCDAIRDELYLLAADPAAAPTHLARHVGWCGECREQLVELLAFARAEDTWRDVVARLVVRVGNGVAAFASLGAAEVRVLGMVAAPAPADVWTGQPARVAVATGGGDPAVEVAVAADGDGRVRLTIEAPAGVATIALRAVSATGERMVASQAIEAGAALVFRQVPVGRYRVTLVPSGAVLALDVVRP